jgi:hypothetical protein
VKRSTVGDFCSAKHRLFHLRRILDAAATEHFGINPVESEEMPPPEKPALNRAARA